MRRLLPLAVLLLGACSLTPKRTDGTGKPWTGELTTAAGMRYLEEEEVAPGCSSDLRICMPKGPGMVNNFRIKSYRNTFASAVFGKAAPKDCDLAFVNENNAADTTDIYSAYTGKFLARIHGSFMHVAFGACRLFSEGSQLWELIPGSRVLAQREPPPAAAPAAAGVTKEDIAAAVAAAMKQQAAAPAPEPARPAGPRLPPVSKPVIFAADRPNDLAVIIGVEEYSDIATKAPYAERDAEAFKAHVRALGVPERNIVLLTGSKASRSALVKNVEGWLPRMSKPGSRVYFYFSGHGAPDPRNGTAYLVPWDGDPNFLDATGYPVNELYKRLGELPASQVLVALDSCFSGAGGRSVLPTGARPLVSRLAPVAVPPKLTVLTASASNEISGSLDEKGHGAFTWFLLEGLNAGKRSAKELHAYLLPKVQDESRRLNRDQTPQLLGADAAFR